MAAKDMAMIGAYAFTAGLIVAIVLGLFPAVLTKGYTILLLGVLGIIVGLLNIGDKELQLYLVANIAFLAGAGAFKDVLNALPLGAASGYLVAILQNVILFVAPAAAIVALKAIYEIAKE